VRQETIRRVDYWIGRPLCFLLTVLRFFLDLLPGHAPSAPRKIVFLKLIEQGATVLAHGAIQAAVRRVGRENVYFLVFEENRFIVDLLDAIPRENVLAIRHGNFARFLLDCAGALLKIRRLGIDTTIDMEFFARATAIFAFLAGARFRVGLHRFNAEAPYRGDLLTHRLQYNPFLHVSQQYRALVDSLDEDPRDVPLGKRVVPEEPPPRFTPTEAETAAVRATLEREAGTVGRPLVLLNANAGDLLPIRRWPNERWIELGKRLLEEHPTATLALTGAPSEAPAVEAVRAAIGSPRAVSLAGKTTLREVFVLYALADLLITNDSGPGQFSAMTDIRSIVFFGPEEPRLFGPRGKGTEIIHPALACSPCVTPYNHRFTPCRHAVCMESITVDSVLERARASLNRAKSVAT
jgi:ADP-heptose:LPS heptosyltransferase